MENNLVELRTDQRQKKKKRNVPYKGVFFFSFCRARLKCNSAWCSGHMCCVISISACLVCLFACLMHLPLFRLDREQLFITSKLWNTNHHPSHVRDACLHSLRVCSIHTLISLSLSFSCCLAVFKTVSPVIAVSFYHRLSV